MPLTWIHENPALWDAAKQDVLGGAPAGALPPYDTTAGGVAPGDWWRVERDGEVVGYGWMDVSWGDAEILLAVSQSAQGSGVGGHILGKLEEEARARGLKRIFNTVRPGHPERQRVMAWLGRRGFSSADREQLYRVVR